jgi:hypothetical protein
MKYNIKFTIVVFCFFTFIFCGSKTYSMIIAEKKAENQKVALMNLPVGKAILYAISLNWPKEQIILKSLNNLSKKDIKYIKLLGSKEKIDWIISDEGLIIKIPDKKPCNHAFVFKIKGNII